MPEIEVDLQACRGRQKRLLDLMAERDWGLAVLTRMESIQWLTGARVGPLFTPCAALDRDGRATLVLPARKASILAAADEVLTYTEKHLSTMRDLCDQKVDSIATLLKAVGGAAGTAACEATDAGQTAADLRPGEWAGLDTDLFRLRRRKDADELALMRVANEANRAMYELAREMVAPGVNELDVYTALYTQAVKTLGEPLTYFGQDFRSNARGGAPRDRCAQAGELYILDLGVGLRGYHTDNARTIAVGGEPTDDQQRAWSMLAEVFPMIEATVKPGVSCVEVFEESVAMLAGADPWVFNHHLGHGVGLAPHEGPHLNPNWDDRFEVGDYFTVEPGLYHDDLRHGIRLEQNYVVTETGVELMTDWPLEL